MGPWASLWDLPPPFPVWGACLCSWGRRSWLQATLWVWRSWSPHRDQETGSLEDKAQRLLPPPVQLAALSLRVSRTGTPADCGMKPGCMGCPGRAWEGSQRRKPLSSTASHFNPLPPSEGLHLHLGLLSAAQPSTIQKPPKMSLGVSERRETRTEQVTGRRARDWDGNRNGGRGRMGQRGDRRNLR